jgi:hypothetical protein
MGAVAFVDVKRLRQKLEALLQTSFDPPAPPWTDRPCSLGPSPKCVLGMCQLFVLLFASEMTLVSDLAIL